MTLPNLDPAYLVTGYLDPAKSQGDRKHPKAGTLVPVADRFFSFLDDKKQESLYSTDAKGILHPLDSALKPLNPKWHLANLPMTLKVLPQGLVRQAYFANLEDWQKVLVEAIRKAELGPGYKTIPIRFQKKDLKKPDPENEAACQAYASFKDGVNYSGQLFPRVQAVHFLLPVDILANGKAGLVLKRDGKVLTSFKGSNNGLKRKFEKENSLTRAPESAEFHCYSHSSIDQSIAEGFHVLEIPGASLKKDRFPAGSPALASGLRFGCDIAFSLRTLQGDFDYHVLRPVSVESALLSNFPDSYVHLQKVLFSRKGGSKPRASLAAQTTLQFWGEVFEWTHAKRQMALGYINAENEGRVKDLFAATLDPMLEVDSDSLRRVAKGVKGFWDLGVKGRDQAKGWMKVFDTFRIIEENKAKLKLVRQSVDANFLTRAYKETRWQRYIINELREAEKLRKNGEAVTNKIVVELVKKDADPKALRKLMKDGIPFEAENFEKLFNSGAKGVSIALWWLDTAYTGATAYSAVKALQEKGGEAGIQERRLNEAIDKYVEKHRGSIHPLVIERLDGMRKLADAARIDLTEAQLSALKNSVEFTLKTAVVVPVIGEVAGLAALGIEGYDLLKGLTTGVYEVFFGDAHAHGKRLDLLDKEYAANVRSILKAGTTGSEKSPFVQFRLRALALIGFLRLLHRCGSRLAKKDDFARKVKEYRLEDYLKTYLLSTRPVKFPVFLGLPIDQLWLYSYPGHHSEWKENWNGTSYPGVVGGAYVLDFQGHFPIHGMDAKSIIDLAETFCLDFSGAVLREPVFDQVYARKDANSEWTSARDCEFPITPFTEIRVAVVFKGEKDLTGIPLSIQLIRTGTLPDTYGPVYKTLVVPASMSLDGKGEDQGLIADEKAFADGKHYCVVVHPHYTFRETLYKGVKPLGHIGMVSKPRMAVGFKVGAGTGGQKGWIHTNRDKTDFLVHLHLEQNPILQMVCEKPFLDSRSDAMEYRKLFYEPFRPEYVGVMLKNGGKYVYYPGSMETLKKSDFDFAWESEFEILLLFHSSSSPAATQKRPLVAT